LKVALAVPVEPLTKTEELWLPTTSAEVQKILTQISKSKVDGFDCLFKNFVFSFAPFLCICLSFTTAEIAVIDLLLHMNIVIALHKHLGAFDLYTVYSREPDSDRSAPSRKSCTILNPWTSPGL